MGRTRSGPRGSLHQEFYFGHFFAGEETSKTAWASRGHGKGWVGVPLGLTSDSVYPRAGAEYSKQTYIIKFGQGTSTTAGGV